MTLFSKRENRMDGDEGQYIPSGMSVLLSPKVVEQVLRCHIRYPSDFHLKPSRQFRWNSEDR
jgi:hypothetical protein